MGKRAGHETVAPHTHATYGAKTQRGGRGGREGREGSERGGERWRMTICKRQDENSGRTPLNGGRDRHSTRETRAASGQQRSGDASAEP